MKLRPLSLLFGCLLLLLACNNTDTSDVDARGTISFTFETETEGATTRVDENNVHDIHILVYNRRGRRVGYDYFTASDKFRLEVPVGTDYTVYAVANTGNPTLFDDTRYNTQSALTDMVTPQLSAWAEIEHAPYLLLSGIQTGIQVTPSVAGSQSDTRVSLLLTRLAARISFYVVAPIGSNISISGFQLCSLPRSSYYLPRPLGGYPYFENEASDSYLYPGDDASQNETDTDWINSIIVPLLSESSAFNYSFYCYENRQGVHPNIVRQRDKNALNAPQRASYLLVKGSAPGYASISWRIYLGGNATSNFNIKRNATYQYNVTLRVNETDMRVEYQRK
jgi:hypothetical protein